VPSKISFRNSTDNVTNLLDEIVVASTRKQINGLRLGTIVDCDEKGTVRVFSPELAPAPQLARTVVQLSHADLGREVALLCEAGQPNRPVIIGVLESQSGSAAATSGSAAFKVQVDESSVTMTADKQIVLRCGDASITLTRTGKVIIRGAYICSRSTGQLDVKGASVHIN
jgi:hypothetical protein